VAARENAAMEVSSAPCGARVKMFSKEGVEMMDVKSIQPEGENLVLKGKMMGSMYASIHLRPQDLWQALRLLSFTTLLRLPAMLFKGFLRNRKSGPG
jgi:hypothetical protein